MARIAGINIPVNKHAVIALQCFTPWATSCTLPCGL